WEGDVFVSKLNADLSTLMASTYIGGADRDDALSMCISDYGMIFVGGKTRSTDFPATPGVFDESHNGGTTDAFIAFLDDSLSFIFVSTYLGGDGYDSINSISIDSSGNIFATGDTWSTDFPVTPGAYDETKAGVVNDIFVSKLSGNLGNLLASTYLGSNSNEITFAIDIDSAGNVYVAGYAFSNFPTTPGAYDTGPYYSQTAIISKLDSNLANLLASTYLGGNGLDSVYSMSIDGSGDIFVTGITDSTDFPTTGVAYDTADNGSRDGFISRIDADLENLVASTYFGGERSDESNDLLIDSDGDIWIVGFTLSDDLPVSPSAYDTSYNHPVTPYRADGFISQLDSNLSTFLPNISVSPTSHDFGHLAIGGSSAPQTFTISNLGTADLEIGTVSVTGTDDSEFSIQNDNCSGQTVAPLGSCTVDVVFSPSAPGAKSANLTITSDDPYTPSLDISLSGTGNSPPSAPEVDVAPDSPLMTDTLVCTVTRPSTDPDEDTVTYTYEWYRDQGTGFELQQDFTTVTTALSANVGSENTAEGDVWRCVVTPDDGMVDGPSDQDEVTVGGLPVFNTTFQFGWNMFSFPLNPDPADWDYQLGDEISPLYIYYYDQVAHGYRMYPATSIPLANGLGYWAKVSHETGIVVDGSLVSDEPQVIHLLPGWNQIGQPFNYSVDWGNVQVDFDGPPVSILQAHLNDWVSKYLYSYSPALGGYKLYAAPDGQLDAWKGYWVRAYVECDLIIPNTPIP
ncbi:SBBP repeat-containing protein, partial [Chloroflexota bacterium]